MGALFRSLLESQSQKAVAAELDIDQTYVSLLAAAPEGRPRGVGAELIRKVLEVHRVDPWYFYDFPADRIPDWHKYVIPHGRPLPPPPEDTRVRKRSG